MNKDSQVLIQRICAWALILGIFYLLKSFFLLIFLTFVFAYIQTSLGNKVERLIPGRMLRVIVVGVAFLGVLIAIGIYLVPQVRLQAETFARGLPSYLKELDKEVGALGNKYEFLKGLLPEPVTTQGLATVTSDPGASWNPKSSPTASLLRQLFGSKGETNAMKTLIDTLRNLGVALLGIGSAFFLALLFSFLIVLDLPALTTSVKGLERTRLGFIYREVGSTVYNFGRVLGHALQAQVAIALLNTILTAIGLILIGLADKLAFLSLIVFLCSFIPVAGVFLSSLPICLLMIQKAGFFGVLLTALLIWVIHLIEAYILNPRIFGRHLHLNPVLALIVLTIGGKLFGVWGLVLGLPVCTYVFRDAIRYKTQ